MLTDDKELLAWLRDLGFNLTDAAADRIEQLAVTNEALLAKVKLMEDLDAINGEKIEALEAKLATCEKYRDAYAECDRMGTQAVRDLEAKLEKAVALLIEASTDLTAYVDADYPPESCVRYPDIARRHHRDLELVRRIDATLAEIKGESHE